MIRFLSLILSVVLIFAFPMTANAAELQQRFVDLSRGVSLIEGLIEKGEISPPEEEDYVVCLYANPRSSSALRNSATCRRKFNPNQEFNLALLQESKAYLVFTDSNGEEVLYTLVVPQ